MPCVPTMRCRCSCATTGGGRRAFVDAFLVLLVLCTLGQGSPPAARRKADLPHAVFNARISKAADEAIENDAGPSLGQSAAVYHQALAQRVYVAVAGLEVGTTKATSKLVQRFGVVVWPSQFRPEFCGVVQYGSSAKENHLATRNGATPFLTCSNYKLQLAGGDPTLGVPCPVGNSVYGNAQTEAGQWINFMVYYNTLVPHQPVDNEIERLFAAKVKECRSSAADDTKQPQISLTFLAECVYLKTAALLVKPKARLRGMAAIISYGPGIDFAQGGLHEAFGVWNPLGSMLINHFTVTNRVTKSFVLMGQEIMQVQTREISVYFVTALGTPHQDLGIVDGSINRGDSSQQQGE